MIFLFLQGDLNLTDLQAKLYVSFAFCYALSLPPPPCWFASLLPFLENGLL